MGRVVLLRVQSIAGALNLCLLLFWLFLLPTSCCNPSGSGVKSAASSTPGTSATETDQPPGSAPPPPAQLSDLTSTTIGTLKVVAGGTFTMGSAIGWDDELPTHSVTLATFHLSATEITQAQYTAVTGNNPSYYTGTSRPVEQVTWYDAVEFCNKLSDREGLTPVYTVTSRSPSAGYPITSATVTMNRANNGYRLPTEAEREFAARGGNSTHGYIYAGSNTASFVAWTAENSIGTSHDVATKIANELGIYDLSGNVWEWCWDWYDAYPSEAQTNPTGPDVAPGSGSLRIIRGESFRNDTSCTYVSARDAHSPDGSWSDVGFRVVRP